MINLKAYIVLDESGAMHLKNERYFVIAGFITRELHKVTSSHKRIEEIVKQRKSSAYQSIIEELNNYIDLINIDNNELLSKAVNYYNNNKKELYTYLDYGYLDISNNLAERVVKPFVIARKSFLFCKTADGATTTGKLFSIVQTARANGLKSEEYLTYVISNINKKDINDLLPWSNKLPKELLINK